MIIELRDKIFKLSDSDTSISPKSYTVKDDAVAALIGLGYNHKTADNVTRTLIDEKSEISLEDLIKESLQKLNK